MLRWWHPNWDMPSIQTPVEVGLFPRNTKPRDDLTVSGSREATSLYS